MKFSFVIPNWNGKKFLPLCLDSLKKQKFSDFEVIIVDNGSKDGSKEYLAKNFPWVRVIALSTNTGLSVACNKGMKAAKGDYVILLNNDVEVPDNFTQNLAEAIGRNPSYKIFACKILCFDKRNLIDSAGDGLYLDGRSYRRGHYQEDGAPYDKEEEVFGPCGAAAVFHQSVFSEIGYLDEDFFAFYEDVDFNFRAQLFGFKCLYVPSAFIYHIGHGSSRDNHWVAYLCRRNENWMLLKNIPADLAKKYSSVLIWPRLSWFFKDILKFFLRYKYDKATATRLKANFAALRGAPKMWRKRKKIQKGRKVDMAYLEKILKR